jgi:DNA gyrase subunit B
MRGLNLDKKLVNMAKDTSNYSADDISVLEGLEPVRKRPGMYIGSTGPDGLHHLIKEIFDNSRDEAMAGHADHIEITLLPEGFVRVADNGRGIPVGIHSKTKVSALETIMTTLHAGGKFGGDDKGYKVSGGLHGVGASVVNALSTTTKVVVHREGGAHFQEYKIGKPLAKVKKIGASKENGTIVTFQPDIEIFKEVKFDWKRIVHHYREQAYLVRKLRVTLNDAREYDGKIDDENAFYIKDLGLEIPSTTFYFEGGIVSMVAHYNEDFKPVNKKIFYTRKEADNIEVEIALQYVDDISSRIMPFANNIYTPGGGMHVTGFKTALTRLINNYNKKNNILNEKEGGFTGDDVLEGLTTVISVKMPDIQFEGQTKDKLGSPEARGAVESVFSDAFSNFLEENPDEARAILNKAVLALKARKAAKAAKDSVLRKGALEGMTLPGKLADCQSKSAEESELFIVEGDSAGGSTKMGRDRRTQAVLPLKGKILNVERARLDKMLASSEVKALVIAIGTSIGDTFNIDDIRYHKIIIATDADVDGAHIRTLLLTLFYRYFKPVIEAGYLYIAQPPLYKVTKGKEKIYLYSDDEKNEFLKKEGISEIEFEEQGEDDSETESDARKSAQGGSASGGKSKLTVQRYKGLGEMNPDELKETTMDPANRILLQVKIEDAMEADKTFDMLMGSEVPPRKSFIQTNAKLAEIDI